MIILIGECFHISFYVPYIQSIRSTGKILFTDENSKLLATIDITRNDKATKDEFIKRFVKIN